MKIRNLISVLLGGIGAAVAAVAIFCCIRYADAKPILLTTPQSAQTQVITMMDAACTGDFDTVSQSILGAPELGLDKPVADTVGELLWDAYLESMHYELAGECYATEDGIAQDIVFTSLELDSVTSNWHRRSNDLLEQLVREAKDTTEIYDENNEYREDFVMDVLYDAAVAALEEDARLITQELTIQLQYQDGRWQVVSEKALLDALFGGIL